MTENNVLINNSEIFLLNSPIVRNVKTEVLIDLKDYSVSEL